MEPRRKVTCWYRWDPAKKTWAYNHLQFGHVRGDHPEPLFPSQIKPFTEGRWRRTWAYMDADNYVEWEGRLYDSESSRYKYI